MLKISFLLLTKLSTGKRVYSKFYFTQFSGRIMTSSILSIGTATPPFILNQKTLAATLASALDLNKIDTEWFEKVFRNTAIDQRHSVLSDLSTAIDKWNFFARNGKPHIPSWAERAQVYEREAMLLAETAASRALSSWGGSAKEITHIISVSCTGSMAPGIEALLIPKLELPNTVQRYGINFMGCFGAFRGLALAHSLAQESSEHRILLVCTELCSLHFHPTKQRDTLIGFSLFGDGAAAVIVGGSNSPEENVLWEIVKNRSCIIPNSEKEMTWTPGDVSYIMKLSAEVPKQIRAEIRQFVENLLGPKLSSQECSWAAHPGGKAIIHGIQKACRIQSSDLECSWEVLKKYGNMSSPTFLFVLDALQRSKKQKEWTVGVGFGPGLAMEGILLRKPDKKEGACA
jgi:predicted naringenin-chalcone synthase